MGYAKILVPCLILLASCGGGGLFSGFGFNDCSSWRGMWAGSATSDNGHPSGIINLTITQKKDSCNVVGFPGVRNLCMHNCGCLTLSMNCDHNVTNSNHNLCNSVHLTHICVGSAYVTC